MPFESLTSGSTPNIRSFAALDERVKIPCRFDPRTEVPDSVMKAVAGYADGIKDDPVVVAVLRSQLRMLGSNLPLRNREERRAREYLNAYSHIPEDGRNLRGTATALTLLGKKFSILPQNRTAIERNVLTQKESADDDIGNLFTAALHLHVLKLPWGSREDDLQRMHGALEQSSTEERWSDFAFQGYSLTMVGSPPRISDREWRGLHAHFLSVKKGGVDLEIARNAQYLSVIAASRVEITENGLELSWAKTRAPNLPTPAFPAVPNYARTLPLFS